MKDCYTQLAYLGAIFIPPLASVTSQLCPLGCTECNDDTLIKHQHTKIFGHEIVYRILLHCLLSVRTIGGLIYQHDAF